MKKNYLKKSVLAVAMALIGHASWAQTPFLTVNVPAEATYPYEVSSTDAASVFEKKQLTICVEMKTANFSGRGAFVCAADPTAAIRTNEQAVGTGISEYVALGHNGTDLGYLKSSRGGDRYTKSGLSNNTPCYVIMSLDSDANTVKCYVNQVLCLDRTDGWVQGFDEVPNAKLYIGAGMANNASYDVCDAVIRRVDFYEGIYDAQAILATKFLDEATEQNEIDEVNALLDIKGVGYPLEGPRTILKNKLSEFDAYPTPVHAEALDDAVVAYKSSSDVQMPEDGKAYVFTNVHPEYGERFLFSNSDGVLSFESRNGPLNELPTWAKFICHQLEDGRYMFVDDEGKYMIWKGSNDGYNDNKGFVAAYDSTYCPMTFHKMTVNGDKTGDATNEDLFGLLCFGGKRKTGDQNSYFLTSNNYDPIFNQDGGWVMRYSTDHSTAFKVEEVPYANTVKMQSDGTDAYATLWLPFATEVPEGVNAYTAQVDETGEYLELLPVEGTLPAGEAVVLKANGKTSDFDAVFVPSLEAPAKNAKNELEGSSLGALSNIGVTYYVLGNVDGIGFYRYTAERIPAYKAYFNGNSIVATNKLNFSFGETTAIEGVQTAEKANAPIYDLSGRRVTKTVKGGIYIQNGQKFMVK